MNSNPYLLIDDYLYGSISKTRKREIEKLLIEDTEFSSVFASIRQDFLEESEALWEIKESQVDRHSSAQNIVPRQRQWFSNPWIVAAATFLTTSCCFVSAFGIGENYLSVAASKLHIAIDFLPKLLGALVILVIGYIIAKLNAWVITNVINRTSVGNKVGQYLDSGESFNLGKGFGAGAFWIIMMFVAIACLKALDLDEISEPLAGLLNQFFEFIPKIIGAAVIGAVAYLIANIAKIGVHKGLTLSDADARLKLNQGTLTNSLPMAAFCFIMLMFLPVIFGALQMKELSGPIEGIIQQITDFLPNMISAGIILAVFSFIAKLASTLITNLLNGTGFNKFPQHLGLMNDTSTMATPAELAGKASMVIILFMGVAQAIKLLKLDIVSGFFNEAVDFVVPLIIGVAILSVGLWLANMARKAILLSGKVESKGFANAAFAGVMVLTCVISLKRMGLANEIVIVGFGLVLGGISLALALAFGFGGRDAAAKFLDERTK